MKPLSFEVDVTDRIADMARSDLVRTDPDRDSGSVGSVAGDHHLNSESQKL